MHTRRPRILFLSPNWPFDKAFGGQLRALHIGRALRQVGDVTLTVISSTPSNEENLRSGSEEWNMELPVLALASPNHNYRDKLRWAFDTRYLNVHGSTASEPDQQRIFSYIEQYDLIWVLNSRVANVLNIWDWPHSHLDVDDVPSTYTRALAQSATSPTKRLKARFQQYLLKRRELLLNRRFTTLSVCSNADRTYLGNHEHIHVIPNGFQRPAEEPTRNLSLLQPRIGFIGLYSYAPNVDGMRWFLEKCWPAILQAIPGARVRLVGKDTDGPLKPLEPGVDALGWISDPAAEIATWSLMVVPIRLGGGTRIKIAEAFSRKCPIVATHFGAFGYEVSDGREIRLAESPSDFSRACIEVIQNPIDAMKMADTAWDEFTKRWTWDAISPKVWAAAEDCLRRSKGLNKTGANKSTS
jgi:polysaccharide biosynthesis protein PslH